MGIGIDLLKGTVSALGVAGKLIAKGALEGAKIGLKGAKITGNLAKGTAVGAVKGAVEIGKAMIGK